MTNPGFTQLVGGIDPDGKTKAIALSADGSVNISGGSGGGGGDASAANQTAVQASAGSNASKAVAVQGITNAKPINIGGSQSKTLLNGVTAAGTGTAANFVNCYSKFVIQLEINSGTLSAIDCDIQASINGNKWQTITKIVDTDDGGILFLIDRPAIQLRAVLNTLTGASPNVSLYCAGVA